MPRPPRRDLQLLAAALVAVALFSAPRFANGFVWDDRGLIAQGEVIHDLDNLPSVFAHRTLYAWHGLAADDDSVGVDTYRPLGVATYFVDASIGGRSPIPYHVTSLLLHLGCVVLVFFVSRRLLSPSRRHLAPFAAAWFGLTPHLAESHIWIAARFDLLVTLFGLGSLLLYRRAIAASGRRGGGLLIFSGLLFFMGLLCKEVLLLALPVFALFPMEEGVDGGEGERPELPQNKALRGRLLRLTPHVVAAAGYLAIRASVLSGMRTHRNEEQLFAALVRVPIVLLDGFTELVVPRRVFIHSMYDDYRALGLTLVLSLGACTLLAIFFVFVRRRSVPSLAWSVLWFVCTLAPAAMIATLLWPGFGRYLYLPFAGLVGGLTNALARGYDRLGERQDMLRRITRIAAVGYLLVLGLRLAVYTTDYHDERSLWHSVVIAAPDRSHGWGYYGATLLEEDDPAGAVEPLRRAVELEPGERRYLSQLGWAQLMSGDRQASLDSAATGIARYGPHAGEFHTLAAEALAPIRPDLAAQHLSTCLEQEPGRRECAEAAERLGLN